MPNNVEPGVTIVDKIVSVNENDAGPLSYDALVGASSIYGGTPTMWRFTNVEGAWNDDPMHDEYGITYVAGTSGFVGLDPSVAKYQLLGDEVVTYRFYYDVQFPGAQTQLNQAGTGYFDVEMHGVNENVDANDDNGGTINVTSTIADFVNLDLFANDTDEEQFPRTLTHINGIAITPFGEALGTYGRLTWQGLEGNVSYSVNEAAGAALNPGQSVTETFTYTVTDSKNSSSTGADGKSDTATITYTIIGKNDAVKVVYDDFVMDENDGLQTYDVLANDTVIDSGDSKTISSWSIRTGNGISGNSGLTFDWSDIDIALVGGKFNVSFGDAFHALGQNQYAGFLIDYTVDDGHGTTSSTYAGFTVVGLAEPVVAYYDDLVLADDAAPATVDVLANDVPRDNAVVMSLVGVRATDFYTASSNVFDAGDVAVAIVDGKVTVDLGEDFKKLAAGESASFYVEYTVHADGEDVVGFLGVTVNGTAATPTGPGPGPVDPGPTDPGTPTPTVYSAASDTGVMTEDGGAKTFTVLDNDTVTPSGSKSLASASLASVQTGAGLDATQFAALGITTADVTVAIEGSQVKVTLGDDFRNLSAGQSVTVTVSYTGASGSSTGSATLAVVVSGATTAVVGDGNNNTLNGTLGVDSITALGGADELYGKAGNDTLDGGEDSDYLDGGAGDDMMTGGNGNDVYVVDSAGDRVIEAAGGGILDAVRSTISLTLADNIELGFLEGAANLNLDGNALTNFLTGNAGDNSITAGAGKTHDTLDGGAGNDTLVGGKGNNTFIFDSLGDTAIEKKNKGTDTVLTSVDRIDDERLGANIENMQAISTGGVSLEGNALNNKLTGNAGINAIRGGDGKDTIYGGAGFDALTGDNPKGKAFADVFVFKAITDSAPKGALRDIIYDFGKGDRIDVSAIDPIKGGKDNKFVLDTGDKFVAGEIKQTIKGSTLILDFNTDKDSAAEMSLVLAAHGSKLIAADFIL